ncbi:hypothetical protein Q3G72_023773 [Acer saccharum]|nr:hypothetical protein Q3G72_023773 [Acer saccharum]
MDIPPPNAHQNVPAAGANNPPVLPHQMRDFAWATARNSLVQTLDYLEAHNLETIQGRLICDGCRQITVMETNVRQHVDEIQNYIVQNDIDLQGLAPLPWFQPNPPVCQLCNCSYLKPVLPPDMAHINWLFLFCENLIGFCSVKQLRFFLRENGKLDNRKSKQRLVYCMFREIARQLRPTGPLHDLHGN